MTSSSNPQNRFSSTEGISERSNNSISCILRNLPLKRINRNSEEKEENKEIEMNETLKIELKNKRENILDCHLTKEKTKNGKRTKKNNEDIREKRNNSRILESAMIVNECAAYQSNYRFPNFIATVSISNSFSFHNNYFAITIVHRIVSF